MLMKIDRLNARDCGSGKRIDALDLAPHQDTEVEFHFARRAFGYLGQSLSENALDGCFDLATAFLFRGREMFCQLRDRGVGVQRGDAFDSQPAAERIVARND